MAIVKRNNKGNRFMQEWEFEYLKDNARILTSNQFAAALGKSTATISGAFRKLKMKPTRACFQLMPPLIPEPKEWKDAFTK